ncbi:MAG TPA: ABC transporter ATP-binding protein [Dehalococcoidia bacterium]|nr:ABC transporter ATP-binding protein [Dehalococcoidia bacterium]
MYSLRLLRFLRAYWRRTALAAICVLSSGAAMLIMPLLIGWAIDYGLAVEGEGDLRVATGDRNLLIVAAAAIIGTAVLRGAFAFGQTYLGEWVSQRVAYDIRNAIYDRLQRLSYAYHDQQQTGQLMSRATQDVEAVRWFVSMGLLRGSYVVILLIAVLILMLVTSWQLALVVWAFIPLIAWRSTVMALTLRPLWTTIQEGLARIATVLQEALTGARVVKAFAREEHEGEKFRREAEALFEHSYESSRIQAVNAPLMSGLWLLATAATLWVGGREVAAGRLEIGELTTFLLYLALLQMPVRALGWIIMIASRANAAGQRIFEILDAESAVREKPGAVELDGVRGHVRFEDVSFAYDAISPVLSHVDIDAQPGQVVALMGPTGSGKTTVVNLMPRFYDVTGGRITIDGVDTRDMTLGSLRQAIGTVQQDVFLFSATIRDNIAYGVVGATDDQIEDVAKAAHIHEFIVSLPDGFDTWVGERGITLSGGQKQRVAIARTLLMDPRILILDDSTSSVDTQTEYQIQQTLQRVMEGRTTFVIAQRLRTVKMADQILVLQEGQIVERGRHEQLLRRDGIYRQIYDLELRDQEEALAPPPPEEEPVMAAGI